MSRALTESDVAAFRERLCEAAARLFFEVGYEGFTMRELAKRLNVSAMTPYRYFKDKDEILTSLRARVFGSLADQLEFASASSGAPRDRTAAIREAYIEFALREQSNYRLMFDLSQPLGERPHDLRLAEDRVRDAMTDYARLLTDTELLDEDARVVGQVLWSTLHGTISLHLAGKLSESETRSLVLQSLRLIARRDRGGMPEFGAGESSSERRVQTVA